MPEETISEKLKKLKKKKKLITSSSDFRHIPNDHDLRIITDYVVMMNFVQYDTIKGDTNHNGVSYCVNVH